MSCRSTFRSKFALYLLYYRTSFNSCNVKFKLDTAGYEKIATVIIMIGFEEFLIGWRKQTTQTSYGRGGKGCCLYVGMYSNKGVVTS